MNVVGARENIGSPMVQQSRIQGFNYKEFGHFAKECRKPKRFKDFVYHKEKMLLCKQAEKGVPLQVEQYDWLTDTDEEIDEHELKAHYIYVAKILEVPTVDSDTDSDPLEQNDQNDVESDDEHVALANLIANLKLDNKQIEFKKYKAFNDRTVDYDKLEHQFRAPTTKDMDILIKTCLMSLALKTQNDCFIFVHELKQEMHADLKYVESLEKEIDELESDKVEFSNMYYMILQECVSNEVICTYLLSLFDLDALAELQCLYFHKVKECDCLAQKLSKQTESVSKEVYTELSRCFSKLEKHLISLELALQKCKEQIVQLILFIVDSRYTKHMTGNLKLLCNFVEKFLGTVRFGNDQFAPILGYGDLVQGFPAQRIRSSNAIALDSLYLLILIIGTSQSRQHGFPFIIVNTKEYHSECSGNYHKDNE
nr:integrase, catalytic region, zinc finger, CCHC-type, peptidase aspartic, catalytic [Tanacetum cinerariifolium]